MTVDTISNALELDNIHFTELKSYHWEQNPPYRPKTFFKLAFLRREGFYCILKCYEKNPRTVFTENDSPVYRDSCLEFFLAPVSGRPEYINIECNSKGISLCEFGEGRQNRRLLSSLVKTRPSVTPFSGSDVSGEFWGVTVFVSSPFICELYGIPAGEFSPKTFRANFYKCGNDTETPHFIAFSPVSSPVLGFHNPDCLHDFTVN